MFVANKRAPVGVTCKMQDSNIMGTFHMLHVTPLGFVVLWIRCIPTNHTGLSSLIFTVPHIMLLAVFGGSKCWKARHYWIPKHYLLLSYAIIPT
jgi:hypothetical protein